MACPAAVAAAGSSGARSRASTGGGRAIPSLSTTASASPAGVVSGTVGPLPIASTRSAGTPDRGRDDEAVREPPSESRRERPRLWQGRLPDREQRHARRQLEL